MNFQIMLTFNLYELRDLGSQQYYEIWFILNQYFKYLLKFIKPVIYNKQVSILNDMEKKK